MERAMDIKRALPWRTAGIKGDPGDEFFDWHVELAPAYQRYKDTFRTVPDSHQVVYRSHHEDDPEDWQVLGVVGAWYSVDFQPADFLAFARELVADHSYTWDTSGDLRHHKIIFAVLRDAEGWYLLLSNFYNGQGSLTAEVVPVADGNVLHNFHIPGAPNRLRVRHVGEVSERVGEAKRITELTAAHRHAYEELRERLVGEKCNAEMFHKMIEKLRPTEAATARGPRAAANNVIAHQGMTATWMHSVNIDDPWRQTKWGALCAILEWSEWIDQYRTDHRTANREQRLLRYCYDGPGQRFRQEALRVVGYLHWK